MEILRLKIKKTFLRSAACLLGLAPLYAAQVTLAQVSPAKYVPCQEMPTLIENFNADYQVLNRFYSPNVSSQQQRGMGGRGPVLAPSPEKRERLNTLYKEYLAKLEALDFDQLAQECKADYILFKRDLNEKLRLASEEGKELDSVAKWFPFANQIYELEKPRRRGIQVNSQEVAKQWDAIQKQVDSLQAVLKNDNTLSVMATRRAGEVSASLQQTLKSVFDFYNGYDPLFTWWVPTTYEKLDKSLQQYGAAFRTKQKPDKNGIVARKPVGREELIRLLQYEMIPYTPEEITDIANEEFAWCEKEMLKVSREMGFGDNWKAAVEKVKDTYVPPGQQPEAMLKLYNESVDFLKKRDLVTIPPLQEEVWGMYMMSPERQRTNAFFTGGWDITISYPTNTMDHTFKMMSMRGNNPNFSRATVHHELIAGHNTEFFMNARNRTYRNFDTPFWVEGWSLYWELLLWDMQFPQTPEEKVGMLFWHMHRCARIIFSFNFHTGKWTPQQCIDFLVEKVGHERANAESEIRGPMSGNGNPLYQVGYLTGGRQFYALKRELVDSKKMTYKEFHDTIMKLNGMPVEMIRAILIGQKLNKDFKTQWRFYDQGKVQMD